MIFQRDRPEISDKKKIGYFKSTPFCYLNERELYKNKSKELPVLIKACQKDLVALLKAIYTFFTFQTKLRKIKEKYGEQDEEERQMKMEILAVMIFST